MKLNYAGKFFRRSFIVAFWVHCIAVSSWGVAYGGMPPRFIEAFVISTRPFYHLIYKIATALPSSFAQLPPLMLGIFASTYFSLWAAIFWAFIGGASGLLLDSMLVFKVQKDVNTKPTKAKQPVDVGKWIKRAFVSGFCLYLLLFLIASFIPKSMIQADYLRLNYPNNSITLVFEFLNEITPVLAALFISTYAAIIGGTCVALILGILAYIFRLCDVLRLPSIMKNKSVSDSSKAVCFVLILLVGSLIPGIAVAGDTAEDQIGRGKTSSSFHYFTDVEYSYREVGLERGGWDFHKAGLKDFTARFGVRHKPYIPQFMRRILLLNNKPIDGHMELFFSVTAEELRQERRYKGASYTTTDIIHTGVSPIFGLGLGAIRYGPERAPVRIRIEARYGEYKKVSYSRRFAGNQYDVQADISMFSLNMDIEWRYRLEYFEPFLVLSTYDLALYQSLIYPNPAVGTNGKYIDAERNRYGLGVGTLIKLKPDMTMRLARHFFNQDAYTIQTEMRF